MSMLPVAPPDEGAEPADGNQKRLATAICRSVMAALGRPADFLKVTVRRVTGNRYRVNVVTGADGASARIAHSFFVTADDRGAVTGSNPAIQKWY
jgi:hypothetical protein